jgi:hypothetical protein
VTGLPGEIVYLLIVAAIMLVGYVWRRRTKIQPWEEALARTPRPAEEAPQQVAAPRVLAQQAYWEAPPEPAWQPAAPRAGRGPGARDTEARARHGVRAPRRFSRQALLGDRRRTQDAVVAAVILGPCRASQPWEPGRS